MGKFAIIGGSSGIGLALANQLAENGHEVFATYNKNPQNDTNQIKYFPLDVTDEFTLDFLPEQLDGLVYCPGTINLLPFKAIKTSAFEEDYKIHVCGAVRAIQQALPALKKSENPSIILFSTVAVQSGYNFHSLVSSSKGAIEGLTRALAAELAPNIRVNAIAPSLTDTPLAGKLLSNDQKREANAQRNPMNRIGQPEDSARMAAFLLSDKASWITGQIMHVDGGSSVIK